MCYLLVSLIPKTPEIDTLLDRFFLGKSISYHQRKPLLRSSKYLVWDIGTAIFNINAISFRRSHPELLLCKQGGPRLRNTSPLFQTPLFLLLLVSQ